MNLKKKLAEKNLPVIVELHKTVAIFDYNLSETSITFEKFLQVPFSSLARNISNVNSLSTRHFDVFFCKLFI